MTFIIALTLDQLMELPSVTDRCRAFDVLSNSLPVDVPVMPYRPGHLTSEVPRILPRERVAFDQQAGGLDPTFSHVVRALIHRGDDVRLLRPTISAFSILTPTGTPE